MSKRPYIIEQGSNNLVIVTTENYELSQKKVKLENAVDKVPIQQNKESNNNNAHIKVNYGGLSINNNVLIDVSKIKKQPNSWAANFLQSIGGTPMKTPRLYHNLASKTTLLRKENTETNNYRSTTMLQPHQLEEHEKVHGLNALASKLPTRTNTTVVSNRPECNIGPQTKVNKDARYFDASKIPPYNRATNEEATKLKNNKRDCKPIQKVLKICKEHNNHRKTAQLQIEKSTQNAKHNAKSQYTQLKQQKPNSEASQSNVSEKKTQGKANKESTIHKASKGITKSKIKKDIDAAKSLTSNICLLKKDVIVLNLKKDISKQKKEYNINSHKESLIEHNKTSIHKNPSKSNSPIKSVVKKVSNYHLQDSNSHHLKKSDNKTPYAEKTNFTELDADLRSKLKRKYSKSAILKDEEIRESRNLNTKVCTPTINKGFAPDEKLIISFNADSNNEAEKKQMSPKKTKKQCAGGKKCKKIKLQINIVLQNSNTTDDETTQSENEGDDESIPENTDVSFLDDFNVDEIVESLNDCKSNQAQTSTATTDEYSLKEEIFIESMDTTYAATKQKPKLSIVENDTQRHEPSTTLNQRSCCLNNFAKIQGNFNNSNTINETIVKNEMNNAITKQDIAPNSDVISTHTINQSNTETSSITKTNTERNLTPKEERDIFPDPINKCNLKSDKSKTVRSPVLIPKEVFNYSPHVVSNNQTSEVITGFLEQKTPELQHTNESQEDAEKVTLINESNKEIVQVKCQGQQTVEIVTIDLTDTMDNSLPRIETEVVIIDIMKPDTETKPILIFDTDYKIGTESKSILDSVDIKNATNETIAKAVSCTDKSVEPIMTAIDVDENKLNDLKDPHTIQYTENKSNNSADIGDQNSVVACKTITTIQGQTKSMKEDKSKTSNRLSVQNSDTSQNNVQSLSNNNNNNTMTKNNELPKSARESFIKDTLVQRIEARMSTYLGEEHYITKLIHRGRFSTLYLYEDKNERKNTIKVLKKESDRYYLGVLKENMLMKLQSGVPDDNLNCVRLIDGFSMSGFWCFLMEYYPKNLQEAMNNRERSFHIDVAQRLSGQLVAAVMILRNNNIIHSDIKPSHILLNNEETRLKLCGFDQAIYYNNRRLLPNVGTVNYRAPELILGYPADYGIDVWSTALVMYEMVTKRQLFPGNYNNDMLYKHLCTLDHIPFDMLLHSRFRNCHFVGTAFLRIVGRNGEKRQLIRDFTKKDRINSVLFQIYNTDWSKHRTFVERSEDKAKLCTLSDLLKQMLVIHPKHRIAIEFVFANPFMYETFDS